MSNSSTKLRPGDVVEVRPWSEIRATLDENGMREGLAFMPEMLKHCGQRFVIGKRIEGTYEGAIGGTPHVRDVVLLRDVRCDGSGHDGCKKACVLCWKQTWLSKVDPDSGEQPASSAAAASNPKFPYQQADGRYRCQRDEVVVVGASVKQSKTTTEETTRRLHRLSTDEYAGLQQAVGSRIVSVNGLWWRQVRPCFFRPLLPYREFPTTRAIPLSAWLGGAQHVVPCGQQANSTMSFLMFTDGGDYSLDSLRSKPRRQVRGAADQFTVNPITNREVFKEEAYPVYTEFHARTQYQYLAERSRKQSFEKWADTIFEFRSSLVVGAWRGADLCAVSIAHAIEDTLIYSTFFATDSALRDHVSSLLLHTVRARASEDGGIAQVYAGIPKAGEAHGIDDFLLRRGCQFVTKPAYMWLNPASKMLLRSFFSGQYARMRGNQAEPESVTAGSGEFSSDDRDGQSPS